MLIEFPLNSAFVLIDISIAFASSLLFFIFLHPRNLSREAFQENDEQDRLILPEMGSSNG